MNDEIEWLNSLDIASCSLVSSVEDLRSGVVLCDLVAYLKSRPLFEDVSRHAEAQRNFKKAAYTNFKIFLREIGGKLPDSLFRSPEELYEDGEALLELVKFLQKLCHKPSLSLKKLDLKPKLTRDLTPKYHLVSPSSRPPLGRLNHSPSMLDIRAASTAVPESQKESIHSWLKSFKLLRGDLIEEFKDGVMLCELINRLEGKREVIKGTHKVPKNKSAVQVNVNKALGFLRNIEKFSCAHLWSGQEIMEGDEEAIYGLLGSIREHYSVNRPQSQNSGRVVKLSSTRTFEKSPSFENKFEQKFEEDFSQAKAWVQNLGLGKLMNCEKRHFLDDPCRNGILLSELISKLEGSEVSGICIPKTLASAQSNFEKCFKFLYEKYPAIALKYLRRSDEIINGNLDILWGLIEELIEFPRNYSKVTSELPYTSEDLCMLKTSLVEWVSNTCKLAVECFEDLISELGTGVLLSEIIVKTGLQLTGITKNPKTDRIKQGNIEKCLDCLRKVSRMSQKFLWRSEDILQGNISVVTGLLEDIHRFHDGLPPRKRGPNYHSDGPYLGKRHKVLDNSISPLRNLTSRLNKSFESPRACSSSRLRHDIIPKKPTRIAEEFFNSSAEFDWLYNLGIILPAINFNGGEIEEFKSGVLLCQIVEKLERKSLSGVENKPKSNAVALHNIGKAMKVLKTKPTFPSGLLFIEEDIAKGRGETIRELLRSMNKIYKQTIRSNSKFRNIEKVNQTCIE